MSVPAPTLAQIAHTAARRLSTEEAAARLGVTARAVRRWADDGRLTAHRTAGGPARGGWRTFDPAQVDALARLLATAPTPVRWTDEPLAGWKPTP